ncbi:MAG: PH domain-containing protein [Candidatus Kapaibacterium sp.]
MYEFLKRIFFPLLKVEHTEPVPPAGHEDDERVTVMRASPDYLRYRMFYWKLYCAIWCISVVVESTALLIFDIRYLWLVIPVAIVAAFKAAALYVVSRADYEMRWYTLTDRSLLIREGVWVVREITLTFANAQNVRVTQGPLQRYFGFANVEVETAGGSQSKEQKGKQHQAVLRGLADANSVRDQILNILRHQPNAGLGDPDDHRGDSAHQEGLNPQLLQAIWDEAKGLHAAVEHAGRG